MSKGTVRRYAIACLTVLSVGALAACGGSDSESNAGAATTGDAAASSEPIVVGIANSQSGALAFVDGPIAVSAEIAAEDINEAGGIMGRQVEVVKADTQSDPNNQAKTGLEVLDKGANAVITMSDANWGLPLARSALERDVLAFNSAGSPLWGPKGSGPLSFSVSEGTPTQGSIAAEFAGKQGWKSVYLLNDTSIEYTKTWCSAFAERFEQLGGTVVGRDTFQQGDSSVSAQVTRLRTSSRQPDVIALCSYPPTGATAIKQIRAAGLDQPIVGTAGFDGPGWLDAVPGVSDVYSIASASIFGDDTEEINDLVERFEAKAGEPPASGYLIYGYSILQALKHGMEAAKSTSGEQVAKALTAAPEIPLIVGPTSWTETCHLAHGRPMRVLEFRDGKGALKEMLTPEQVAAPDGC